MGLVCYLIHSWTPTPSSRHLRPSAWRLKTQTLKNTQRGYHLEIERYLNQDSFHCSLTLFVHMFNNCLVHFHAPNKWFNYCWYFRNPADSQPIQGVYPSIPIASKTSQVVLFQHPLGDSIWSATSSRLLEICVEPKWPFDFNIFKKTKKPKHFQEVMSSDFSGQLFCCKGACFCQVADYSDQK